MEIYMKFIHKLLLHRDLKTNSNIFSAHEICRTTANHLRQIQDLELVGPIERDNILCVNFNCFRIAYKFWAESNVSSWIIDLAVNLLPVIIAPWDFTENFVDTNNLQHECQLAPGLDIDQVARRTEGYSGDDLTNICRDASLNGMRRKIAGKNPDEIKNISEAEILEIPVMMDDFLEAIDKIQPTVSAGDVERHEKWFSEFGST